MSIYSINSVEQFTDLVTSKPLVVVYVFGTHCIPCKSFAPLFNNLPQEYAEYAEHLVFAVSDADHRIFNNITAVPTILYFAQSQLVATTTGPDMNDIKNKINAMLNPQAQQVQQGQFTSFEGYENTPTMYANPSGNRRGGLYKTLGDL